MKSDKKFYDTPVNIPMPIRLTGGRLRRNAVSSRSGQKFQSGYLDKRVLWSTTTEPAQLTVGNRIGQNSRIMAWDNQRIFGPAPESRRPVENSDLEGE